MSDVLVKGWCPSLEKPMETGDGLLVRVPIKFGRLQASVLRKIAELAEKYGNGHLDLSARGNLQIRGVIKENYPHLREELAGLGFVHDVPLAIIVNPLAGIDGACDASVLELAEEIIARSVASKIKLPEKFLIVIDGGGVFPLTDIPCDLYISSDRHPALDAGSMDKNTDTICVTRSPLKAGMTLPSRVSQIIEILYQSPQCNKKTFSKNIMPLMLGYIPLAQHSGVVGCSAEFGRVEAVELKKLADIVEQYSGGKIILAPKRIFLLPKVLRQDAIVAVQELEKIGFITDANDSRLKIHACVGAPACSSAFGDTRNYAKEYAKNHPNLNKIVHITGCPKGCAYKGKADITITANEHGYDIEHENQL